MIEMLISVCLTPAGTECHEVSLLFDRAGLSVLTCITHGQAVIAGWQQQHPDWRVKRWTCRNHEEREVAI